MTPRTCTHVSMHGYCTWVAGLRCSWNLTVSDNHEITRQNCVESKLFETWAGRILGVDIGLNQHRTNDHRNRMKALVQFVMGNRGGHSLFTSKTKRNCSIAERWTRVCSTWRKKMPTHRGRTVRCVADGRTASCSSSRAATPWPPA